MNNLTDLDCKVISIDLDSDQALLDFDLYVDHYLQPVGYNVFIHNPPLNPENRLVLGVDGRQEKLIFNVGEEPFNFSPDDYKKTWDWASTDVWAWIKGEDGKMYHLSVDTVTSVKSSLSKVYDYFNRLLENDIDIYLSGTYSKYLPDGLNYKDAYRKEISYLSQKLQNLDLGYIKRDSVDPEYMLSVCLPEVNLSNRVLEAWRPTIVEFIASGLEEVKFTKGQVT